MQIPDVIGDNKDSAADQLRAVGLRVRFKAADSDENKDDVIAVSPGRRHDGGRELRGDR